MFFNQLCFNMVKGWNCKSSLTMSPKWPQAHKNLLEGGGYSLMGPQMLFIYFDKSSNVIWNDDIILLLENEDGLMVN